MEKLGLDEVVRRFLATFPALSENTVRGVLNEVRPTIPYQISENSQSSKTGFADGMED